ncbi:hypothetical protein F3Y22_tig00112206pilonHSYRG00360 [Hibiscus syriacus]|uniref:Uncharacterized protein n=1 Tax=Hibiscus syriacus TaxID=106335 RepID=A0A6A2XTI0_HIBSY|nr:hypothetical protein F3Y22_tig00112206pilonHSYRG00360 [Hibiscus syriacus]
MTTVVVVLVIRCCSCRQLTVGIMWDNDFHPGIRGKCKEGKLNFNAPLLSVRQLSSAHSFLASDEQKIVENSSCTRADILPSSNWDVNSDQVKDPVAVWEQIRGPGNAKVGTENEFESKEAEKLKPRMLVKHHATELNAGIESSLQDIKGLNILDSSGMPDIEITGSMNSCRSHKPYLRGQADDGKSKGGSDYAPVLPKRASESWLSHAPPAVTSINSFCKSQNGTRFNP